ncbi:MAG TPA: phosphatase PAP2 family protein [Terracidiphilus sp.]|jgi:membrane-associated phospholipid phosphatase|nr:phosphatase PAP2 family protein [Terracidiphilus sp.]
MTKIGACFSFVSLCCLASVLVPVLHAQDFANLPDEPGHALMAATSRLDSLPADPPQTDAPRVDTTTGTPQREATWHSLPGDFLHDQKDLWTFPVRLAKGHYLLPTALVVGGTIGLIYADPHTAPYFRNHQKNLDKVNDVFDPMITTAEVIALPAGLMTAGYIRHDNREVNTALLAAEAYGDSVVINLAMKAITRRERPADVAPNGDYGDTFFNGGKSPLKGSSFPSGHATAVWSVATVVAERYRHRGKPWIPVLAYSLATAISFSRITESAHFASDVWLGASLGYSIAKYQTLSPR